VRGYDNAIVEAEQDGVCALSPPAGHVQQYLAVSAVQDRTFDKPCRPVFRDHSVANDQFADVLLNDTHGNKA
jgi:hypothetical protein